MTLLVDRDALCAAVAAGERFEYRFFWGHTPRAGDPVGDMMAGKARLFDDGDALRAILAEPDRLARPQPARLRPDARPRDPC